jgi:polyisoprenoid-binding protein YceI
MTRVVLLLSLTVTATAADFRVELSPETTKINWTLGDVLHTVHGTFRLKRGEIHFDPESGKASGEVVVDATSGESGSGARDSRMHKNVLESQKYPEISFAPDRVEGKVQQSGTSSLKLHGVFRIHGAPHEITVPVEVATKENQLTANIRFEIPYVPWGMKDPSTFILKVGKSVEIDISQILVCETMAEQTTCYPRK